MQSLTAFLLILYIASPVFGLQPPPQVDAVKLGKITGRVLDKDGLPMKGVEIRIEELSSPNGQVLPLPRDRHSVRTDNDGTYFLSDLHIGRMRVSVIINNQVVLAKGAKTGDEVWNAGGLLTIDFDLGKGTATAKTAN